MDWGQFWTIMAQSGIAFVAILGGLFVGSAIITAIKDGMRNRK